MEYIAKVDMELLLGKQGENKAVTVLFPIAKITEEYGRKGAFQLLNQRAGDKQPYPVKTKEDQNYVYWTVAAADVERAGIGKAELQYRNGTTVYKSMTWRTRVEAALGEAGEVPEAQKAWVDEVLDTAAELEKNYGKLQSDLDTGKLRGKQGEPGINGTAGVIVSDEEPENRSVLWIDTTEDGTGTGYVSFKMFGAKGDGETNDEPAIRACVEYANEHNLPIVNYDGEYYCDTTLETVDTIELKTSVYNTDNVTFLLSDRYIGKVPFIQFVHDPLPEGVPEEMHDVNLLNMFVHESGTQYIYNNKLTADYADKFFVMDTKVSYGVSYDTSHGTEAYGMYEPFYPSNDGCRLWAFETVEDRLVDLLHISSAIEQGYTWSGGVIRKKYYGTSTNRGACFLRVNRNNCTVRDVHIYCDRTHDGGNVIFLEECGNILLENIKGFSRQPELFGYEISAWQCADITARHITGSSVWSCFCTRSVKNMSLLDSQIRNFDVHWDAFGIFVVDRCQLVNEAHVGYGRGKLIVKNSKLEAVATRQDFFAPFAGDFIVEDCDIHGGARVYVRGYEDTSGRRDSDYFYPLRMPRVIMRNCTCERRAMFIYFEADAIDETHTCERGSASFSDIHIPFFSIYGGQGMKTTNLYDVTLTNCTYSNSALTSMLASGTVKSAMYETLGGE